MATVIFCNIFIIFAFLMLPLQNKGSFFGKCQATDTGIHVSNSYGKVSGMEGTIEVVNRHPSLSKLGDSARAGLFEQDIFRVQRIHSRRLSTAQGYTATLPAEPELSTLRYVVNVSLGTPKKLQTLTLDTAADLTWIDCKRTNGFDPSKSTSYSDVGCNDKMCTLVANALNATLACSPAKICEFNQTYGDDSSSSGLVGRDTLTMNSLEFHNFALGCSEITKNQSDYASGVLGLGRHPLSFVSQTNDTFGSVFCYFLQPVLFGTIGKLKLGRGCWDLPNIKYTPFSSSTPSKEMPSFYAVDFSAMFVGGNRVSISSSLFERTGTIFDSGTTITRLPPNAYMKFRDSFRYQMNKAGYPMVRSQIELFDTCYDLSGFTNISVPTISLQFRGNATFEVDVNGVLFSTDDYHQCLAFAPNKDDTQTAIIGSWQQVNQNIIYDLANEQIGFGVGSF